MSLRWRLIISYILIIAVSLTLAFLTLILIARPVQSRLIRLRLAAQTQRVGAQIDNLLRQGVPIEKILPRLDSWAAQNQTRLVFLDPTGVVVFDSQDIWVGQRPAIGLGETRPPPSRSPAQSGTFDPPGGGTFIYAAVPVGPAGQPLGYLAEVAPYAPTPLDLLTELGQGFLMAGTIALALSLFLGLLITRSVTRPLQHITRAASAVAAGDYEHRMAESGPPELKRVAASFNVMIGRVENSQRAVRDFVSNVSHELKTPLTSIQGFSQAIMEGATQDELAQRRAAKIIHQEASRMARLVEDLLDLARIDAGQVVMNKTPVDLSHILANTLEHLLPQAAQKQIEVVQQWGDLPRVVGDGDRLAQVFTNLLDNAVHHTPVEGRVIISSRIDKHLPRPRRVKPGLVQADVTTALSERGDFVEIGITNTGPEIPADDLARIFERFYQVDKSRKRSRGTGLGLAIVKEIVDAHGGYVNAQSKAGEGTTITVVLPVSEADARTLISSRR
ncbi:MAG: HAMP domain-containing histidine kinase [Anaerolineae bacterium]|nr:HAMP domain-containing histidine kinase [Anaerolineae bacterium]